MTAESIDSNEKVRTLEAEESVIQNKGSHHGFGDASRRNRIDEQLDGLRETVRRSKRTLALKLKK